MKQVEIQQFHTVFVEGGPGSGSAPRGPRSGRSTAAYKKKYFALEKRIAGRTTANAIRAIITKGNPVSAKYLAAKEKWSSRLGRVRGLRPPSVKANPRWKILPTGAGLPSAKYWAAHKTVAFGR